MAFQYGCYRVTFEYSVGVPCFICKPTQTFAPERVQVVQLRAGGTLGTQVWPLSLDLQKTVASLAGRLCATMVAGMQTTPPHQGIHTTGRMKQVIKAYIRFYRLKIPRRVVPSRRVSPFSKHSLWRYWALRAQRLKGFVAIRPGFSVFR